jgi:uncharacterized damage-inducible protein DinB
MLTLSLNELLVYTDEERAKWRTWLTVHPEALQLRMQPDGRFTTVGALVDHIFLVEARHLARLRRQDVPSASGVPAEVPALFAYADQARRGLREFAATLPESDANVVRTFTVQSGSFSLSPRKLLFHIALHEVRHWAQIALAIRQAGQDPPGNHDLFYSSALP